MSILSRLFGGGRRDSGGDGARDAPAEDYNGFTIIPQPQPVGTQFRLAARIEKEVGGETRVHLLVRADVLGDRETAVTMSSGKARQVIDEQGDALFR